MNALQQNELVEVDELQDAEQQFEITSTNELNWAFRKLEALNAKENEIKESADFERNRVNEWEQKELKPINDSRSYFEGLIFRYHSQVMAADPKKKTISTPYGKSKSRTSKAAPEQKDKAQVLQYAIENELDDCLKTEVKWGDLKKKLSIVEIGDEKVVVDENGQIVPGVKIKPESISYSVEV